MHKAVILAAGLGTRMRKAQEQGGSLNAAQAAVAATGVKALIPIGSDASARPFLDYVLSALAEAGYTRACLVIGPDHQQIRDYYDALPKQRLTIEYAVQAKPLGTANAVAAAEAFAGQDPFVMVNSDNFYPPGALRALRDLSGNGVALFRREGMVRGSNIEPERIQKFAAGEIDASGNMRRVLEKPSPETLAALGEDIYLSMNCWRFGPSIFDACRKIQPSPRGEYEVTDAVQYVIDVLKQPFAVVRSDEPVLDMSSRGDIDSVQRRLARQTLAI